MPDTLKTSYLLGATVAILVAAPMAFAQTASSSGATMGQSGQARLSSEDRTFLENDARGSAYELQMSQMAVTKAQSADVRGYAQMVVTDHTKYNQALQQVAQENGLTLSTKPSTAHEAKLNRLEKLSGGAFDRTYVEDVKLANKEDATQSQHEEQSTNNQQIKSFINQFKQTDQKHEQDAEKLQVNGPSKS